MKSLKKLFSTIIKLNALAFSGLYLINHRIRINACAEHKLKTDNGSFYNWNDTNVYYEVYGNEGEVILLLHDTTPSASGADMLALAKKLAVNNKVYVIDLPGCGRSDKPPINYTNYYYTQCIHSFIANVIKKPAKIFAVGLTGSFAVTAAALYKEEIASLVLADPWNLKKLAVVPDEQSYFVRVMLSVPVIGESIYNLIYTKQNIESFFSNHMFFNPFKIAPHTVAASYEASHLGEGNGRFLRASLDGHYLNWNIHRVLTAVKAPITILYGEKSKDGALTAKQYREIIPDIMLVSIKKADHALVHENCEETAMHI